MTNLYEEMTIDKQFLSAPLSLDFRNFEFLKAEPVLEFLFKKISFNASFCRIHCLLTDDEFYIQIVEA